MTQILVPDIGDFHDVEVIDVCTISPLDRATIGRSARKTGRVVVVAEACKSYGPTGEWAITAMEEAFEYLRAPIVRVTGRDRHTLRTVSVSTTRRITRPKLLAITPT